MSARVKELGSRVDAVAADLLAAVVGSTDAQWAATCADGEWTQGFAAYHAATSFANIAAMVQTLAVEGAVPGGTAGSWEQIDAMNAATAKEHGNATRAEVKALIARNAPAAAATVRGLDDAHLDRLVTLLPGMPQMSVAQVAEMLLVGHAKGHLESITRAR